MCRPPIPFLDNAADVLYAKANNGPYTYIHTHENRMPSDSLYMSFNRSHRPPCFTNSQKQTWKFRQLSLVYRFLTHIYCMALYFEKCRRSTRLVLGSKEAKVRSDVDEIFWLWINSFHEVLTALFKFEWFHLSNLHTFNNYLCIFHLLIVE